MKKIIAFFTFLLMISTYALSQNIGIGTNTPVARLEIKGETNTSATNNLVLKNSSGDTLFRMRNDGRLGLGFNGNSFGRTLNIGGTGVNFYRTDANFGGAIFPTDTSLILWSNSDENNYVILQPSWGKVGIGTYSPKATLHVNGSLIVGDKGTTISNVIKVTVSKNLVSVPANAAIIETFAVTGANPGSAVSISPAGALPDGILIAYARVSVDNVVEVKFMNVTAQAINPASMNFFISVIE
jgi:hypothetical protein